MTRPAVESDSGPPVYPLRLSPNGRFLVDQHNTPFLIVGDSPQALVGGVSEQEAESFLANRRRLGFNTVWVNLLCNDYTGCRADGETFDGIAPFTGRGDLATPNETYFARVDRIIQTAQSLGLTVLVDPIETGGWLSVLRSSGREKAYAYGQYLGQRYRNQANLIWMSGNDYQSWTDIDDDELVLAVAQGMKNADPTHLQTIELNYYVSSSLDDSRWAPIIQLDAAYTSQPTYAEILKEYSRGAQMPVFLVEANYEFEHDYDGPVTLRRQEYWTMLSGAAGQFYGNRYTWQFSAGWQDHLDTIASRQVGYMGNFFSSRQWFNLVPDQDHTFLTAGLGSVSSGTVNDSDYATAAVTPDGTLGLVYVPTARSVTVNLSRLRGPVVARWYDPSNDSFRPISGSPFTNSGPREFATPGVNALGDSDWVLDLEQAAH